MAGLSVNKIAMLVNPEEFDATKWRYPIAEEPIRTGQTVSLNFGTEKVSLFRPETLVPPDGLATNNADIGEPVLVVARFMPGDIQYLVFRIPDQQSN